MVHKNCDIMRLMDILTTCHSCKVAEGVTSRSTRSKLRGIRPSANELPLFSIVVFQPAHREGWSFQITPRIFHVFLSVIAGFGKVDNPVLLVMRIQPVIKLRGCRVYPANAFSNHHRSQKGAHGHSISGHGQRYAGL